MELENSLVETITPLSPLPGELEGNPRVDARGWSAPAAVSAGIASLLLAAGRAAVSPDGVAIVTVAARALSQKAVSTSVSTHAVLQLEESQAEALPLRVRNELKVEHEVAG